MRFLLSAVFSLCIISSQAQTDSRAREVSSDKGKPVVSQPVQPAKGIDKNAGKSIDFVVEKIVSVTPVKNQQQTGTCWSFSTTSLIESQALKNNLGEYDLSEWFTVRNIYMEKARNYIFRQGNARFSEGGLGHDQIRAMAKYGAMPEDVYSGLSQAVDRHDHSTFSKDLKSYLDTVLKNRPVDPNWMNGFTAMLDKVMGTPPESFVYNNKKYTPESFATEVLKFNADDYVNITSFRHHPYYSPFILEVPDNFSNGLYHNLPLKEMVEIVKTAIRNGYSVMWDADVSNPGFRAKQGYAVYAGGVQTAETPKGDLSTQEPTWNEDVRQRLFESLVTEDDHLMHIVGIEKSKDGKLFFNVKNSWGNVGPYGGYIKVSEAYFAMNTISIVIPRAALSRSLAEKLKL